MGSGTLTASAAKQVPSRILHSGGTEALRVLSHGLMNGITSPARPWFRLGLAEFGDDESNYPGPYTQWLEICTERMLTVLAESNFYNAMGVKFLDLGLFGTSAIFVYEDFEEVVRFYNSPVGEFVIMTSNRRSTDGLARVMAMTLRQMVQEFGLDALLPADQEFYKMGDGKQLQVRVIYHLIEPNAKEQFSTGLEVPENFKWRELYWQKEDGGHLLRKSGFRERPGVAVRWEVAGNDSYGTSPAADALAEVKQLQIANKQRIQAKDKMNRPPVVADIALKSDPTALLPGGVTYVPGASSIGARAIYTVNPPLQAMTEEIQDLIQSIRRQFYNHLFRNVSDLSTVRSATEIAERKAEDMVLLGPVLERFENEALDPIIKRVFAIMMRKGLFPEPPEGLRPESISVRYISILADAQRAINTGSTERFMATLGQLGAIAPEALKPIDFVGMLREYDRRLNVPAASFKSPEVLAMENEREQAQLEAQQAALVGNELTNAAKNLSQTEVGSGRSALDQLLG
jgi:hypothetical protein